MALALGCLLGKLLKGKGLEGLEEDKVHTCGGSEVPAGDGVWRFGGFWRVWRVWRVWSFGEFWRVCGLANGSFESLRKPLLWPGPGVPVGEVALALGCLLGKVFGILFWKVWSLCGLANGSFEIHKKSHCCGPGPGGLEFWRRLEPLRAGKRQL